tara:strand:+ start:481 stop:1275 length:795 start_codon:yes stop_codon:yes gene_type:complete
MINTYLLVVIIIIAILFVSKNINKVNVQEKVIKEKDNIVANLNSIDYPETTTVSKVLNKIKENIPLPILQAVSPEPIHIIKNTGGHKPIKYNPIELNNQMIVPNPGESTEYRFIEENPKKAWSDKNVSQFPKYHSSNKIGEFTKTGGFFDSNLNYNDNISPNSTKNLPDRCFLDENSKVVCDFNDRLQNIPPSLVGDPENTLLSNIGNENLYNKGIYGGKSVKINEEGERPINGGEYFKGVKGFSGEDGYLSLDGIVEKTNYSI